MNSKGIQFFYDHVIDSSSDDEEDDTDMYMAAAALMLHEDHQPPKRRGSIIGRSPALNRDKEAAHERLFKDYFHRTDPVFKEKTFRRRFRMSRNLFMRILNGVRDYDSYFECKPDATGLLGFSSYQKCSAAIRMLAYGVAGDLFDEYFRLAESTCLDSMYMFCQAIIAVFRDVYLREPTAADTQRLLSINEAREFPGMIGSIDCMHWEWKNCPFGWQGQFKGHVHGCVVILEAVASQDLWIWHSYFGMAGSHNDINVLQRSPVFDRVAKGNAPQISVQINGNTCTKGYYLGDDIYPEWSTIVKTIPKPVDEKSKRFAREQEACRKDVERTFGVLQSCWAIVRHLARIWTTEKMWEVMTACVIMHNMIVEEERDDFIYDNDWQFQRELVEPLAGASTWEQFIHTTTEICDRETHNRFQKDLVEHMWTHVGNH